MGEEPGAEADLASLRALLVGPEQQRLAQIQARLDDRLGRAEDLAEVLPQVLQQHAHDPHLARALTPPLEKAITASVQRNPQPLADALFPVMGPAIRKAVAAGLAGMVESLNRTLEHSLSWKSLQWRLEARRAGKSFGEIVLLKTLVYRVEQVFLIERASGLLLQHVHAGGTDVQDADMVSGMLSAIRDFARDSFKMAEHESLDALTIGDSTVWVEAGPHAFVAAVVRGSAPREFRQTLVDAVETVHLQFGETLEAFSGDTAPFVDARPALEACLGRQYRADARRPRTRGAWLVLGVVAVGLVMLAAVWYRSQRQWHDYLDRLRAEPGIVVIEASRTWRRFTVSGLRDPLARDPRELVAPGGLRADDVVATWAPYVALDPSIVVARARGMLAPPSGVALAIEGGRLFATGEVPVAWVAEAARLATFVPGATGFDAARTLEPRLTAQIGALEAFEVRFVKGSAEPIEDDREGLARLAADVQTFRATAAVAGRQYRLNVVGHTDAEGPDDANLPLSLARAARVKLAIEDAGAAGLDIATTGVGSTTPRVAGQTEPENQQNRRVQIRVTLVGGR